MARKKKNSEQTPPPTIEQMSADALREYQAIVRGEKDVSVARQQVLTNILRTARLIGDDVSQVRTTRFLIHLSPITMSLDGSILPDTDPAYAAKPIPPETKNETTANPDIAAYI